MSKKSTLLKQKDLSVTALYTAQTWVWGQFEGARIYETDQSRGVFGITNLALLFMKAFRWKMPSLHHSLVQRHTLIDQWIHHNAPSTLIEVACGLSARSLRFIDQVHRYVDVDLAHMIDFKKACLEHDQNPLLSNSKMEWVCFDLHDLNSDVLSDWTQNQVSTVIAEGLMMYLTQDQQQVIWTKLARSLPPKSTVIFDFVPTIEQNPPGLIGRVLGWCMRQFTGGQSFVMDQRDRFDIIQELKACGFVSVDLFDVHDPHHQDLFKLPFAHKRTQNLIFVASL